ncbi:hypothetical protein AWB75_01430 [Caballeronia catudaia]|uniref:Uncharacterized protein n=1 Tax=Caballeronia catudaia TaxID=1777136 RepID=A0A157ZYT9_9BURK|nr:hypothetical protein AWB75_01430 [Caballeronia catudaia]
MEYEEMQLSDAKQPQPESESFDSKRSRHVNAV